MATSTEIKKIEIIANGKKANASFKDITASVKILNNQLKKMTPGTKEFVDKTKELKQAREKLNGLKKDMYGFDQAQGQVTKGSGLLRRGFSAAVQAFLPLFAFSKITELVRGIFAIDSQWTKLKGTIEQTSGLQGEALDEAAIRSEAIANSFGRDNTEIFNHAKSLVNNFKISYDEAFSIIEGGIIAAGDKSDEFLEQIGEYSVQFADAGASAEGFAVQTIKALNDGIYSDKGADAIKEFGLRVREQTNASKIALEDAFGKEFTKGLFDNVNNGSLNTVEALQIVSKAMNDTSIPANKLQTVVADMFGGAGEDAGLEYLKSLEDIGGEMSDLIDSQSDFVKKQQTRLELEKQLAKAQESFAEQFEGSSGVFSNLILQGKILFFDVMATGIQRGKVLMVELINYFINLYNESIAFRYSFEYIRIGFNTTLEAIKLNFSLLIDTVIGAGEVITAIFTGNFSDIPGIIKAKFKEAASGFKEAGQNIASDVIQGIENAKSSEKIQLIELDEEGAKESAALVSSAIIDEQSKALEIMTKANADYQKKRLAAEMEFAQLKIDTMKDGVDKELAIIDLKHESELAKLEEQRLKILENDVLTATERQAFLDQLEVLKNQKEADKEAAKAEARELARETDIEKELEEFEEDLERELLLEENRHLAKEEQLQGQFEATFNAEAAHEQSMLDLKILYSQRKLDLLIADGKGETKQALKLKNSILKLEKEKTDKQIDFEKKSEAYKKKLREEGLQNVKDTFLAGAELLGENTAAGKTAAKAHASIQAGEVIASGIKEVQSIWEGAAQLGPFVGPVVGAIQTGIAVGRTTAAVAKLKSTAFASGGGTDGGQIADIMFSSGAWRYQGNTLNPIGAFATGGYVGAPSLGLIGEDGPEWVGPNWMLRSPKYANIFGYLESERLRARPFADGGSTSGSIPVPDADNSGASSLAEEQMEMMMSGLQEMFNRMDQWQSTLKVINNPEETEEALQVRNEIDFESTITRSN